MPSPTTLAPARRFALHGWIGLALIAIFWPANWFLGGHRTVWGFFPLWLGYCLSVDALTLLRTGTSWLHRSRPGYITLFLISSPAWWLFELFNQRVQNWRYLGVEIFTPFTYFLFASISFSVVMPAVFGSAELLASTRFIRRLRPGPIIRPDRPTTLGFFIAGWVMLAFLLLWPAYFFPFLWLSVYFILEPVNVWLGIPTLADSTRQGDWRPVISLWLGVLLTGFFWELWNFHSYPKWIYTVPWVNFGHVFEMPILGYGGYLPFALELSALYRLVTSLAQRRRFKAAAGLQPETGA